MTVISKAANKAHFTTGSRPTQSDFGDLIDSYTDYSDVLTAIGTSAAAGNKGIPLILSASAASLVSAGTAGLGILAAVTTAQAQSAMGGGTVGRQIFETATTAAAAAIIGAGDMTKAVYDPANINQQLVGTSAAQTVTGKILITAAASAAAAGFNLPHGTAPSSPNNGDLWSTTSGVFARVNASTLQLNGMTLIQTQTVSGVASVNFTDLSSTYSHYILKMANVVPATDATDLYVRTSTNNGSPYDAGASDYAWTRTGNTDAAVTAGAGGDVADNQISIAIGLDNAATASLGGTIELFEVASSARHKHIFAEVAYTRDASTIAMFVTGGKRLTATAVNAFQVLMSSGNISGTFSLYGVAK